MIRGNIRDYIIDVSNLNSEESIELIKTFIEIYENIDSVIFTKKYLKYSNIHDKWVQVDFPDIILSITADEVKEYAKRIKNENPKATEEYIPVENTNKKLNNYIGLNIFSLIGLAIIIYSIFLYK